MHLLDIGGPVDLDEIAVGRTGKTAPVQDVVKASFSPDGDGAVIVRNDGTMAFLSAQDAWREKSIGGNGIRDVMWSPTGRHILVRTSEKIELWDDPRIDLTQLSVAELLVRARQRAGRDLTAEERASYALD